MIGAPSALPAIGPKLPLVTFTQCRGRAPASRGLLIAEMGSNCGAGAGSARQNQCTVNTVFPGRMDSFGQSPIEGQSTPERADEGTR